MARRRAAEVREITPDPRFGDELLARFINRLMVDGKKSIAEGIVYGALDIIEEKLKEAPLEVFKRAIANVSPVVEVKSRRVGGATYQVPIEVSPRRRTALAIRWIIEAAKKRGEKSMMHKLAGELMDAAEGSKGGAVKKREEMHRTAEANKAFSHYRW
jgi:small subunit ribosomal protein S7